MIRDFFRHIHINALTLREEHGQTMAEYGVVLAVLTIATVGVFTLLSGEIKSTIDKVISVLSKAGS